MAVQPLSLVLLQLPLLVVLLLLLPVVLRVPLPVVSDLPPQHLLVVALLLPKVPVPPLDTPSWRKVWEQPLLLAVSSVAASSTVPWAGVAMAFGR